MNSRQITKAFFELCKEENKINIINQQLDCLNLIMSKNEDWVKLLDSPMLTFKEKTKMVEDLNLDSLLLSFLKMLIEKRGLHLYKSIYRNWLYLNREYQNIAYIQVVSAKEINGDNLNKIIEVLQPRFKGREIKLDVTVDENLIGGIVTIYKGQSLDQSIARDLEELFLAI